MTTRTKLYITGYTASAMMMLNVFSKPLHIPEAFKWVLSIGVFIPLGLALYYIKRQKQEKINRLLLPSQRCDPLMKRSRVSGSG